MLSRRNIRVKVLQILYSLDRDKKLDITDGLEALRKKVKQSYILYLQTLYVLLRICSYASDDKEHRAKKLLPSEGDRGFSDKLFNNVAVQSLAGNNRFIQLAENYEFAELYDEDIFKKLYKEFSETEEYLAYMQKDSSLKDHIQILHELLNFLKKNANFNVLLMDGNSNWIDDDTHVYGAIKRTFKAMPLSKNFMDEHQPDEESVTVLGNELLKRVEDSQEKLKEIINPLLKNWDYERLALVDLILLKMAIIEFLHFENIPTSVTINEYLELAKNYSTEKSKVFINGVLDKALHELQSEGKIVKTGRGLLS